MAGFAEVKRQGEAIGLHSLGAKAQLTGGNLKIGKLTVGIEGKGIKFVGVGGDAHHDIGVG